MAFGFIKIEVSFICRSHRVGKGYFSTFGIDVEALTGWNDTVRNRSRIVAGIVIGFGGGSAHCGPRSVVAVRISFLDRIGMRLMRPKIKRADVRAMSID